MPRFTEDTLISDVLAAHPQAAEVFQRLGLGCPSCIGAEMESVSAVASMHDVSLRELLDELNATQEPIAGEER